MKHSRKIAIIGSRGIPAEFGGFETFAEQLAVRLVKNGFQVTVFCEDSQKYRETTYQGVQLVYIKTPDIVGLRSIWFDLINIIKTLKGFDIVYMLGYHAAFAFVLPWLFRTNFWVNMDGLEWKRDKWSPFAKRYLKFNERLAAFFARKLVADAQGIADYLKETYKVADKTLMIPYGAYLLDKTPDVELIAQFQLEPDKYYLVVCRLEPENHVREIIQGFLNSRSNTKLIIIGDHKSGTDYVDDLLTNSDERIMFLGSIYDQIQLTALRFYCKAYIHGHSVGGTNPSLLEAMASGNYVIAHDNVFNREVTDGAASYFSDSTDLSQLLNQYEDREFPVSIKEQLTDRIHRIYNWDRIVQQYISVF